MIPSLSAKLTPATATEKLKSNDPTLTTLDLSNNAVLQMKGRELYPQLFEALATNYVCMEINLSGCSMNDFAAELLSKALEQNKTLAAINLENNIIGNEGATAIARALAVNRGVMLLNLMGQKGARFGDTTLAEYLKMLETNVTLLKIIWRLESRQSFRLTKMLTRNNDIDRKIKAGRNYADLLPEGVPPLSADLIDQRAVAAGLVMTPRPGAENTAPACGRAKSNPASARRSDETVSARLSASSFKETACNSGRSDTSEASAERAIAKDRKDATLKAPVITAPDDVESAIAALMVEKEKALAKLEAEYAAKKEALLVQLGAPVDVA